MLVRMDCRHFCVHRSRSDVEKWLREMTGPRGKAKICFLSHVIECFKVDVQLKSFWVVHSRN